MKPPVVLICLCVHPCFECVLHVSSGIFVCACLLYECGHIILSCCVCARARTFFSVGEFMCIYTANQVCISVCNYGLQEYAGCSGVPLCKVSVSVLWTVAVYIYIEVCVECIQL